VTLPGVFIHSVAVRLLLTLLLCVVGLSAWAQDKRQSSYWLMSPETRAMQDDEALNPATFWILDGQTLWNEAAGKKQFSLRNAMVMRLSR